jgi:outer membrane lipoprotein-sorting protein
MAMLKIIFRWSLLLLIANDTSVFAADAIEQLKMFSKSAKSSSGDFVQQQVVMNSD